VVDVVGQHQGLRHFFREKVMMGKRTSNANIRRMLIKFQHDDG
jgi:hypothetical protein